MGLLQAKVTTKGQITLPKAVREQLSIQTGDRVEFSVDAENQVTLHRMQLAGSSAGCARPFVTPEQKSLTDDEIQSIMAEKLKAKYAPKR